MANKTAYISQLGRNYKVSDHFTLGEIASKDGADKVLYSEELLMKLEETRAYGGFTVSVNSFYRSAAHNKRVGGASNSSHTRGLAADVVFKKDGRTVNAELICCLCQSLGFDGVAYISPSAVHLDMAGRIYRGDERKGYRNNVENGDFYAYFNITKAQVNALKIGEKAEVPKKEEEAEMTKDEVKSIVYEVLAEVMTKKAQETPGEWSKEARAWAKDSDIIKGTGVGDEWKSPVDREQLAAVIYRVMQRIDPIK